MSSQMKKIITVGVERSIAPTMVPAKFHWQETCGIYDISFQIFMYVTCTPAKQSGGATLFLRTVGHMTKELKDPFHHRDHSSLRREAASQRRFFTVGVGVPALVHESFQHDVIIGMLSHDERVNTVRKKPLPRVPPPKRY